jgi:serine/threonine protein kinase
LGVIPTVETARQTLNHFGITKVEYIASGMEGHVFRLEPHHVVKVWHAKTLEEVTPLKDFYERFQTLDFPFETPLITQVQEVEGVTISIEKELHGILMRTLVKEDEIEPSPFALEAVLSILEALKDKKLRGGKVHLPILGVVPSRQAKDSGAIAVLLEVAHQKVKRYGDQLRRSIPDFDWIYQNTVRHLLEARVEEMQAVHGDLCPENILLDEQGKVTAVLDWGMMSLFGDSVFDASFACGIYNMYGPYHRQIDEVFLKACEERLNYSRERLLLYRALYAIIQSNAFSETGSDGHYAWCVETLCREDICSVLARGQIT